VLPALLAFALVAPDPVPIQAGVLEIPFTVVDGAILLAVELQHGEQRIPVHLQWDLAETAALRLHARTAELLELAPGRTLLVRQGSWEWACSAPIVARLPELEAFTRDHARALREIPTVGILGPLAYPATRPLEIDFERQWLRLHPEGAREMPPEADPSGLALTPGLRFAWRLRSGVAGVRIPATVGAKEVLAGLSTVRADSALDPGLAGSLGHPALDPPSVRLDGVEVAPHVLFRPPELPPRPDPQPPLLLGSGFLASFRLLVDRAGGFVWVEVLREPDTPEEDREVFRALACGDARSLEATLKRHLGHRAAADLARRLFGLRIAESPPDAADVEAALTLLAEATPAAHRTRFLLDLLPGLAERAPGIHAVLRPRAIALALEHAEKDGDPDALHRARSELGQALLDSGDPADLDAAHRHLLAAALAMPRDGLVNLRLGLVYERLGKTERAWSRFLSALVEEESAAAAWAGLERVARTLGRSGPGDPAAMERVLSGRVPAFEPASRHEAVPGVGRRPLVEVFTSGSAEIGAAAELAVEGALAHFGRDTVLLLHHPEVGPFSALAAPASTDRLFDFGLHRIPALIVDAGEPVPLEGRPNQAAAAFRRLRTEVEAAMRVPPAAEIGLLATVDAAGLLRARVRVAARDARTAGLHLVLAERLVLHPGRNRIVLHRRVVRASFPGTPATIALAAEPLERVFELRLDAVERSLAGRLAEREEEAGRVAELRPIRLDPAGLVVAAWLEADGRVLQAASTAVERQGS
jgi:hypothetical protein